MNIFELGIFGINCASGYLLGKVLAAKVGLVGWFIGIPTGFLISLAFFYGLSRLLGVLHDRKVTRLLRQSRDEQSKFQKSD